MDKELFEIELKIGNFDEYCMTWSEDEELSSWFYFTTILQALQQFANTYPKLKKQELEELAKKHQKLCEEIIKLWKEIKEENFISAKKLNYLLNL